MAGFNGWHEDFADEADAHLESDWEQAERDGFFDDDVLDDDDGERIIGYDAPEDNFRDDVDADADTLKSAGYGTDEDYGWFGGGYWEE